MNKTKRWILTISITVILSTIVLAQIFSDENAAVIFRNTFTDYPETVGEANITKISARLDDENVIFEWEITINNKRDGTTEKLRGAFEILKADRSNVILIQDTLELEVNREFEDLNRSFIPNPMVEYRNHPFWGKTFIIPKK